jgi:hypothetical protein
VSMGAHGQHLGLWLVGLILGGVKDYQLLSDSCSLNRHVG